STPSSSRSCPELPPLSNIVTTALRCSHGLCFRPPSRLGRPVPPPKQPTLSSRKRIGLHSIYNVVMQTSRAVQTLEQELRGIFGDRLQSLVAYGERARQSTSHRSHGSGHGHQDEDAAAVRTIATVATLTGSDLRACARRVEAWHQAGLATPLVLA